MKLYAVYDCFDRQLSAATRYKTACNLRRVIREISRIGGLQAIIATPPFRIKEALKGGNNV